MKFDLKSKNALYQVITGLTAVTLILIGCIIILSPFFSAMLLATIFTLATWPAFIWILDKLHGRKTLAAFLMTALLAGCFIVPVVVIGTSVADNYAQTYDALQNSLTTGVAADTIEKLQEKPYIGPFLEKFMTSSMSSLERINRFLQKHSSETTETLIGIGKTVARGLFDITLGVVISYFLFRYGTTTAERVETLINKFGGEHGRRLLIICKNTLTGVVYGLLGTALAQGTLAALGFWIADVPGATFLGFITFFLSFLPFGPALIWGPAALWLFSEGHTYWAFFVASWGVLVISMVDNIMKPYFISLGSDLPLLLILLGVMGGALAFGFIGLFIGPTLLALAYSLMLEWSTVRKVVETEILETANKP